jgi:hypothetical protein
MTHVIALAVISVLSNSLSLSAIDACFKNAKASLVATLQFIRLAPPPVGQYVDLLTGHA